MTTIKEPLVSVIVPVYNVENYIDDCLNSITQQTYKNLEIIVVEDCSTDSSLQMLQSYLDDKRIKLVQHQENGGLSAARNTGIKAASGEYLMFVDSDDIIDSNLVEICLQASLDSAADVVLLTVKPFEDGEQVQIVPTLQTRSNDYKIMSQVDYLNYDHFAWLKFIRTELIRSENLQFPVGQYYEDWPFHWKINFVASKIVNVTDGYYHYRQRGNSITGSYDNKLLHIFSSHLLIANIADEYNASIIIRKILATKIYRGIWFVLTTINDQYLAEAVIEAKKHLERTSRYSKYKTLSPKIEVLLLGLSLPDKTATLFIKKLRLALNQLSLARRKAKS